MGYSLSKYTDSGNAFENVKYHIRKLEYIGDTIILSYDSNHIHDSMISNFRNIFNILYNYQKDCKIFLGLGISNDEINDDVDVPEGIKYSVLPDLAVMCKSFSKKVPILVVEVLSPSTLGRDLGIKKKHYKSLGIKEYWLIYPIKKEVCVCNFVDNKETVYGWNDICKSDIFPELYFPVKNLVCENLQFMVSNPHDECSEDEVDLSEYITRTKKKSTKSTSKMSLFGNND